MNEENFEGSPTSDLPPKRVKDSPQFHGTGGEFFGIWIINIIFSLLTLGIYTAWAKVRVRRYFAVMTSFRGERFDYHASAWPILKGRIIAFILFSIYVAAGQFSPLLAIIALVLLMLLFPFLMLKSFQFNANNTSYRNIRFKYFMPAKEQWTSYIIAILPILLTMMSSKLLIPDDMLKSKDALSHIPVTFFVLMAFSTLYSILYFTPFFVNWLYSNLYNNLYFGDVKISINSSKQSVFKKILLPYFGLLFGLIFSVLGISFAATYVSPILMMVAFPIIYLGFLILGLIFPFLVQTYIWNNLETTKGQISCDLPFKEYILKSIGLTLLMGFTLGFAYPWVRIHFLEFFYSHRHFELDSLNDVKQVDGARTTATADEVGDAFDFDFDIGL